jgi:hypothetical protein
MTRLSPWIIIVAIYFMVASLYVSWFRWYKEPSCIQICLNCTEKDLVVEKSVLEMFPYDAIHNDRIGTLHINPANESTIVTISRICLWIIVISFILAPLAFLIEIGDKDCAEISLWPLLFIISIIGFAVALGGSGLSQEYPDFRIDMTKVTLGVSYQCGYWYLKEFIWRGPILFIIGVIFEFFSIVIGINE